MIPSPVGGEFLPTLPTASGSPRPRRGIHFQPSATKFPTHGGATSRRSTCVGGLIAGSPFRQDGAGIPVVSFLSNGWHHTLYPPRRIAPLPRWGRIFQPSPSVYASLRRDFAASGPPPPRAGNFILDPMQRFPSQHKDFEY